MDTNKNQELLFLKPVFKEMLWGGKRLGDLFGYDIPGEDTGECWGISAHPNGDTVIAEGAYQGKHLSELWNEHRELFGNLPGDRFPLLIKLIDAKQDLSIQVHPDDAYAKANENGSLGKTECWYILDCTENASLVIGHHAKTKQELADWIHQGQWDRLIRRLPIKKGDFIQIDPGTVHAITAGCMILETQQNSDITYRVYDYDRLTNGKPRELHVQKSLDVITVPAKDAKDSIRHTDQLPENHWNELISCPYYKVYKLTLHGTFTKEQEDPFLNISVLEGSGSLNSHPIKKGDHFIVPAGFGQMRFAGEMELVASTIKMMANTIYKSSF